ncbi:hypothetical protein BDM02DRAFT_3273215 [Thelephora ganbajun]|uniref:Uncharacterized protein n=1 Tax=Thelephora ganbajun TaxID=370292 RepID=A0ACB6Z0E2_THEGA|nr:hypothetical protein BDM02DRAFT_3273215 [Thelephora ganbajun]
MAKDYGRLWKDVTNATSECKAVHILTEILSDEDRAPILHLGSNDAKLCVDILGRVIVKHNLKTAEKHAFFVTLRRLARSHGRLPDSTIIKEKIKVEDEISASHGFTDIRLGRYRGYLVAVRALRVALQDGLLKRRKQFCKEVILWGTLSHPNVLKLAGVQGGHGEDILSLSEWMAHGNIMVYIKKNRTNRLELLHGAAQGLGYLHGASLIHGDLKGRTIRAWHNDVV